VCVSDRKDAYGEIHKKRLLLRHIRRNMGGGSAFNFFRAKKKKKKIRERRRKYILTEGKSRAACLQFTRNNRFPRSQQLCNL